MKKIISLALFLAFGYVYIHLSSCTKEYLVPEVIEIPDSVGFAEHIIPIFEAECVESGCHNTGGIAPNLEAEHAYLNLNLFGFIDTENPSESMLYKRFESSSKPMPPSGKLSASKIELVLKWIEQGALDN